MLTQGSVISAQVIEGVPEGSELKTVYIDYPGKVLHMEFDREILEISLRPLI
jgi:hypothetical protein